MISTYSALIMKRGRGRSLHQSHTKKYTINVTVHVTILKDFVNYLLKKKLSAIPKQK